MSSDIHIRISDEEKEALNEIRDRLGLSYSDVFHEALKTIKVDLPYNIKREIEKHKQLIKNLEEKLHKLSVKEIEHKSSVTEIIDDFRKFNRGDFPDDVNIGWLENRVANLHDQGISITIDELLIKCKNNGVKEK